MTVTIVIAPINQGSQEANEKDKLVDLRYHANNLIGSFIVVECQIIFTVPILLYWIPFINRERAIVSITYIYRVLIKFHNFGITIFNIN